MNKQLTPEDIKSIAQAGEGYNAEFKIHVPNKVKEITEEICAFANSAGGVLLIGVSDDNVVHGTTLDNAKRSAIQNSINEINPHLATDFYSVEVEGKTIWVIEVNTGIQKPYALSGVIYVRQGPNTQKLTTVEQMRDFFQQSDRIYFDEAPCNDFDLSKDIDPNWFEEFRLQSGLSNTVSQEQIIHNLKLILLDGSIKNGGVLFFGTAPEQFIETAVIRCIAFDGINKTNIIDDKVYGGALMKQYEQTMQWLKGKLSVRYEIEGSGPRKEIWEIPETAFKEAIINALSHRDYYDKGARITIELFKDRVEISNPGGLTSAISLAEFGTKSHSRNPLIFGLFVRIHMVEQVGSGISRIRDLMKSAKLPEPQFKTDGMFTVVFQRAEEKSSGESSGKSSGKSSERTWAETIELLIAKSPVKIGKSALKILEMVYINQFITIPEMAKRLGITERAVEKNIRNLRNQNLVIRKEGERSGYWKLLPKNHEIRNS
ncbi:ATP-binding protein [Sphingobacterium gobiense]|uniref:ArsR family transcriptional regulator n=1 Tax=Sphingobacterium gobiense TaxID=1382456 RepID=A0A2S9JG95_9SPHI|nr:ATP-binding protein [Sphingobacterium gobiense]PRD51985.1 ArsR family transcriptional regulator [Sphingobacterium gobiense]